MSNFYYNGWGLYSKEVILNNSPKARKIYFFSKNSTSGTPVTEEEFSKLNFEVKANEKTGLPFVKKKKV